MVPHPVLFLLSSILRLLLPLAQPVVSDGAASTILHRASQALFSPNCASLPGVCMDRGEAMDWDKGTLALGPHNCSLLHSSCSCHAEYACAGVACSLQLIEDRAGRCRAEPGAHEGGRCNLDWLSWGKLEGCMLGVFVEYIPFYGLLAFLLAKCCKQPSFRHLRWLQLWVEHKPQSQHLHHGQLLLLHRI